MREWLKKYFFCSREPTASLSVVCDSPPDPPSDTFLESMALILLLQCSCCRRAVNQLKNAAQISPEVGSIQFERVPGDKQSGA